jgi:hypothetical protein
MTPFHNGSIRQQEIAARNLARQRVARMLALEATRSAVMVAFILGKIAEGTEVLKAPEAIWIDIQDSAQLVPVRKVTDNHVADYPEFASWVSGRRSFIERTQKRRMNESLGSRLYQQRFANTTGFRPAYA